MEYVVVDIETTGFSPHKGSEIIEIGVTEIIDGEIVLNYSKLIKPIKPIPHHITKITNITNEMVKDMDRIEDVLPKFRDYLGDRVMIAHNAQFDLRFLNFYLEKLGLSTIEQHICTLKMLKKESGYKLDSYKLEQASQYYGIEHNNAHRADSDTFVTAQIFLKLANS